MLTKMSLESARELAEVLANRRIAVSPMPETPLADLVEAGQPVMQDDQPTTIEESVESLEVTTVNPNEFGTDSHDAQMQHLNSQIVNLMNRRLNLARTVINPLIEEYSTKIAESMARVVPVTPEVEPVEYGEFYNNPLARNVFTSYKCDHADPVNGISGVAFNDNTYTTNAFNTGSEIIDTKLRDIVARRGEEWVKNVAALYFNEGESLLVRRPELTEDYLEYLDKNMVVHFLARYFYGNNEVLTKDSTEVWEGKLLDLLGRTSQNINAVWDHKADLEKREVVVPSPAAESHVMTVYKPMYDKFIAKGGNNTMLMGAVKFGRGNLSIESILENGETYEKQYDNNTMNEVLEIRDNRMKLMLRGALEHLVPTIHAIPREVIETIPEIVNNEEGVDPTELLIERGREYINTSPVDVDNCVHYAERIICVGLLPELDMYTFFREMDRYILDNEGTVMLTPPQAAYYAALQEVVKYFLSQTSLSQATV